MAAIRIGGVQEAQAVVVAVQEQVRKTFDAESGLVGMMADADRASAHSEAAGLDAGPAESYRVRGAELMRECRESEVTRPKGTWMEPSSTGGAGGAMKEFAAFHAASQVGVSEPASLLMDARGGRWVIRYAARLKLEGLHSRGTERQLPIYHSQSPAVRRARRGP